MSLDNKEKEVWQEERLEELKERQANIKKRNKTYLKGRYGKRLYYDKDKKYVDNYKDDYDYDKEYYLDDDFEENYEDYKDPNRQVKCIYTKDFRRNSLFGYLKYLKGKKVLVRDLAWKFAVTERTIQSDLKFLIDNDFIERKINYTYKGKQTKNSYIVNTSKQKYLPYKYTFLSVVFLAKLDNEYYILTKTDYKGRDKSYSSPNHKTIKEFTFRLPTIRERYSDNIDNHSQQIANNIFNIDLNNYYKGYIYTDLYKYCIKTKDRFGFVSKDYHKEKFIFTMFNLHECLECKDGYRWIKLSVAPRRIKYKPHNKCLKHIADNLLG